MSTDTATTSETQALAESLRTLLDRHDVHPSPASDSAHGRAHRDLWPAVCGQLGIGELAWENDLPHRTDMLARCFEVVGARLAQLPMLSTLGLALPAARVALGEAEPSWLCDLVNGERTGTLTFADDQVKVLPDQADGWRISGDLGLIIDGTADTLLVVVEAGDLGSCLFRVDGTAPGLVRDPVPPFDTSREITRVTTKESPCSMVGEPGIGQEVRKTFATQSTTLLAAEQFGGAQACFDFAVSHAKTRFQFGRSLGSFQSIKHRLSDLYVGLESTRTAVRHACAKVDAEAPDAELWGAISHLVATENYVDIAKQSIQVHGGIGFTWEHPLHLFLKRAKASGQVLGAPPSVHRIGDLLNV
ncbi:acyl-CoA dehydrogenase family protein [Nocardioides sp. AE5]|uniref:acyl-CoA dehydrogenase family protein n=1 Tax=Nocardioides sp. AE5 TaxID=2962573 RepID=UPI0028814D61|nr:acyl-CoA dehydrogenase family protein [Nocardioides sp. AE5]MDT0203190.1 acyl-CoA dehydrogenase family protein [Nocardioides sp. AE5]